MVEKEQEKGEAKKPAYNANPFVATSPDYLPFGHGDHACSGHFLVDFELKMIVAYILKHYDLGFPREYNGKRPSNRQVAELQAPRVDWICSHVPGKPWVFLSGCTVISASALYSFHCL
ncbi:hypothetical protein ETB97_001716 [Aspergillus alliaceus]|uniref:Cytochrome P450 n=1 Tax=Petromyces alliaceus TaxID=209559 RepID=A0A8H6E6W2_PETAA|nr:hypothetical protein ETB97_001716 [Aspergillus burnettii]